jgi:hypothetical protein
MATRRFGRMAATLLLLGGSMLGGGLIEHVQAQAPSVPAGPPPTTPTQSPTVNPSNPSTVQQPSYRPLSPTTPSTTTSTPRTPPTNESKTPANEQPASANTASERETSAAKTRTLHRHRPRRAAAVTYACSHLGCVRTYAWAFPCQYYSRYCFPYVGVAAASARWGD